MGTKETKNQHCQSRTAIDTIQQGTWVHSSTGSILTPHLHLQYNGFEGRPGILYSMLDYEPSPVCKARYSPDLEMALPDVSADRGLPNDPQTYSSLLPPRKPPNVFRQYRLQKEIVIIGTFGAAQPYRDSRHIWHEKWGSVRNGEGRHLSLLFFCSAWSSMCAPAITLLNMSSMSLAVTLCTHLLCQYKVNTANTILQRSKCRSYTQQMQKLDVLRLHTFYNTTVNATGKLDVHICPE